LKFYPSPHAPGDDFVYKALDLFEKNMKTLYENSAEGYDREGKILELGDNSTNGARYIVVEQESASPGDSLIGFTHMRFCNDDDDLPPNEQKPVLYIYEIQVSSTHRGKSIGTAMMKLCEEIARATFCSKLVLTVFKNNKSAVRFYMDKMSFEVDETDPSIFEDDEADYYILSKRV